MYVRKLNKGGKEYLYYYKSKRIGNKVKSIYVGKALEKKIKKPLIENKEIKNVDIATSLLEFDNLLNEINKLIHEKDLNSAISVYDQLFNIYQKVELKPLDKEKIFNKLDNIYKELIDLGRENKIKLLE